MYKFAKMMKMMGRGKSTILLMVEKRGFKDVPDMGCYEFTYPKGIVISFR